MSKDKLVEVAISLFQLMLLVAAFGFFMFGFYSYAIHEAGIRNNTQVKEVCND